jgi:hypothetical protein
MKIDRKTQPAFPAFPMQDNFGKIMTAFPGLSQYEHVLLQFALTGVNSELPPMQLNDEQFADAIMAGAKVLTEAFFRAVDKETNNDNGLKIIK